jgi:hypothetical protein
VRRANSLPTSVLAARLSVAATLAALLSLASLHVLSPEFDPSWRMVSEYANGRYGWVLSLMFVSWALSSWALAFAVRSGVRTLAGKLGLAFLVVAGVGWAMASIFDVNYERLHHIAAYLSILGLPIAAMLISICLVRTELWSPAKRTLLWTANLTWASLVLMVTSAIALDVTFLRAGGDVPPSARSLPPGAALPPGTIAFLGYANRLLIGVYCLWLLVVAWYCIRLAGRSLFPQKGEM